MTTRFNLHIRTIQSIITVVRPHHWLKNTLIFIPLLAAHRFGDIDSVIASIIVFCIFCLSASGMYVLNDLLDVKDDRLHHRKRYRPFAAGDLSLVLGWFLWPLLLALSCLIAVVTQSIFVCVIMFGYIVATIAYSLKLKQIAIVDVFTLAGLYTLRIVAGAAAIDVALSFWLLAFSLFIFLSLAFIKRVSELQLMRNTALDVPLRGRGYVYNDLNIISIMGVSAGYLAVLILALYIQDPHTTELYRSPRIIWVACPLLLYWISRLWFMAVRGQVDDDPIVFAIRDRLSWVIGACCVIIFGLASVVTTSFV